MGWTYLKARQYSQAVAEGRKALELYPRHPLGHKFLGQELIANGETAAGVSHLEQAETLSGGGALYTSALGYGYGVVGNRPQALAALDRLIAESKKRYVDPFDIAFVYSGLADRARTIEWLEKAYAERTMRLTEITLPAFDFMRSDPRFRDIERRMSPPQ